LTRPEAVIEQLRRKPTLPRAQFLLSWAPLGAAEPSN
jgi:hypothetical protein